jgi:ABC-type transport system involved in cytochrome c biogenesis ATPase subunit
MKVHFTIPYLNTPVDWNNGERTYIIGLNGSGKTLLLNEMMQWCEDNNYSYNHYYAMSALQEAPYYIANAKDDDIALACKWMAEFSFDFKDDIQGWAKHKNGNTFDQIGDYMRDVDLLRDVLGMCGAGYTRMFVMFIKALENPDADYYFLDLPETSLHLNIAERITDLLMHHCEYTKFVVATHSPEVIKDVWNSDGSRNYHDVIELNFDHINQEQNRKFQEMF